MRAKSMHSAWNPDPTKRLAPGDGSRLVAGLLRERIGRLQPSPYKLIYFLFQINQPVFHNEAKLGELLSLHKPCFSTLMESGRSDRPEPGMNTAGMRGNCGAILQ